MAADQELEAMTKIAEALGSVSDESARTRILKWALSKYASTASTTRDDQLGDATNVSPPDQSSVGPKATRWLRQVGLSPQQLEQVFHFNGKEVSLIASTIPGRNASEQVCNCYLLEGVRNFLASDESIIVDVAAKALCRSAGCYDSTNHAKRVKNFSNRITGDSSRGWVVTGPGLAAAAALIKELAGN